MRRQLGSGQRRTDPEDVLFIKKKLPECVTVSERPNKWPHASSPLVLPLSKRVKEEMAWAVGRCPVKIPLPRKETPPVKIPAPRNLVAEQGPLPPPLGPQDCKQKGGLVRQTRRPRGNKEKRSGLRQ